MFYVRCTKIASVSTYIKGEKNYESGFILFLCINIYIILQLLRYNLRAAKRDFMLVGGKLFFFVGLLFLSFSMPVCGRRNAG